MHRIVGEDVTGRDATVHWRGLGATAVVKLMPLGQGMVPRYPPCVGGHSRRRAALAILSTLQYQHTGS